MEAIEAVEPIELFSMKDVAELLLLQEARLRYWAQTGFVGPSVRRGSRFFYTFEDLISVRAAKELVEHGIPMQRIRKQLDALRDALPGVDRPLTRLRVCSDGEEVLVVADDHAFDPSTRQLVMSFAVAALDERITEIRPLRGADATPAKPTPAATPRTAYACFLLGVDAHEARDVTRAEALYRRAVELDPGFAAAWSNLGRALESRRQRGAAREAWEKALTLDPELAEARYNLANLHADVGEDELALGEYRRVVASAPDFADAHFNLAALLDKIGAARQSRVHYQRYLELDPASEWSTRAKERLAALPK